MEDGFGDPVQDEHVGRVTQVVIGLDHQDLRFHAGLRKVTV